MLILRGTSRNLTKIAKQMSEIISSEREDVTLAGAAVTVIYDVVGNVCFSISFLEFDYCYALK